MIISAFLKILVSVFNMSIVVSALFFLMSSYVIIVTEPTLLNPDFWNVLGFDVLSRERILNCLTTFFLSFSSTD